MYFLNVLTSRLFHENKFFTISKMKNKLQESKESQELRADAEVLYAVLVSLIDFLSS